MNKKIVVIIVTAAILASVHLAEAQKPTKVQKIGFLTVATGVGQHGNYDVFRQALRELGYVEGQNVLIENRAADDRSRLLSWQLNWSIGNPMLSWRLAGQAARPRTRPTQSRLFF
jgi:hypothetical protein